MSSASSTQSLRSAIDSLTEALRLGELVLVVGPEALTVSIEEPDGRSRQAPFYRLVAERLLASQHSPDLPLELLDAPGPSWDLHRACAAIMAHTGLSAKLLCGSVKRTIRQLTEEVTATGTLAALAALDGVSLIVCLTPDDLLRRTIEATRPQTSVSVGSYSLHTDISRNLDIPSQRSGLLHLHHLLGRIEDCPTIAIHEEDALEYLYRLRNDAERSAKTLLEKLQQNHLLFLGCGLPDWMGRGLIRLFKTERLSVVNDDSTFEFFGADVRDATLNGFLDQFSRNSIVFPWAPLEFVQEIQAITARTPGTAAARPVPSVRPRGGEAAPSAFVSYASEDADAALQVTQALKSLGFGKVWLDREALIGGDHWPGKIEDAIATCDFFVPLLSRRADGRREGVFWGEWQQAIERSRCISGEFLLPIGIDSDPPLKAGYERIFKGATLKFRDLHLPHAPQGHLSDADREQLSRRVRAFATGVRS